MRSAFRVALLAGLAGIPVWAADPPPAQGRLTDAQAAELARGALGAQDPTSIRQVLVRLRTHAFRSSRAPEREIVLYTEGVLEERLGNLPAAAMSFRSLERQWPQSPYTSEAQVVLADVAISQKHYGEAETRLHRALAADIPSERKRKAQELLLWALVQQDRPLEGLPIVQGLLPLAGDAKASERGLAAMALVLCAGGDKVQAEGARTSLEKAFPASPLVPRVQLAYGQLLGRSGDAPGASEVLQRLLKEHAGAPEADEARLALADLLTSGKLGEAAKNLPSPQALLDEIRKGGRGLPKGRADLVQLRVLVAKSLWEDALDQVDRTDPLVRASLPEIDSLWETAWRKWVDDRLEKGFAGALLARLKPGTFRRLTPEERQKLVGLLASKGLVEAVPPLLPEVPAKERGPLVRAALAQADPQGQPTAVLRLLPVRGGTPGDALLRAQALAALGEWSRLREALPSAKPGPERVVLAARLLQRPLGTGETASARLKEAEGWLARLPEKGAAREPLAILVADLRFQAGDPKGALALYPAKAADPAQRGWVALMRAQALVKLGQRDAARALILDTRYEQGFSGQRDALAKALGAY